MFAMLPGIGPTELVLTLALVLIIFGPGKLPDIGREFGKTIREFKGLPGAWNCRQPREKVDVKGERR